jgi:hypothetical protein
VLRKKGDDPKESWNMMMMMIIIIIKTCPRVRLR